MCPRQTGPMVGKTPGLQLETRQAPPRQRADFHTEAERLSQGPADGRAYGLGIITADLQANLHLVQRLPAMDVHRELTDFREPTDDILHRGRIDVNSADDQQVVDAPDHAAFQPPEGPPARAGSTHEFYAISRAVADHRHAGPPQVGDHKLAFVGRLLRVGVDHLADELAFAEMNAGLGMASDDPHSKPQAPTSVAPTWS